MKKTFFSLNLILENDRTIYLRGCHIKDNIQLRGAELHLCNTNHCNSADKHRPTILFTLLFTTFLFIKLMRF